jgi:hypothetical protein
MTYNFIMYTCQYVLWKIFNMHQASSLWSSCFSLVRLRLPYEYCGWQKSGQPILGWQWPICGTHFRSGGPPTPSLTLCPSLFIPILNNLHQHRYCVCTVHIQSSGSQTTVLCFTRDVVYLGWPIAPSYMSPNAGRGGSCGVSANKNGWTQEPK